MVNPNELSNNSSELGNTSCEEFSAIAGLSDEELFLPEDCILSEAIVNDITEQKTSDYIDIEPSLAQLKEDLEVTRACSLSNYKKAKRKGEHEIATGELDVNYRILAIQAQIESISRLCKKQRTKPS